jgi:hypothetical protein
MKRVYFLSLLFSLTTPLLAEKSPSIAAERQGQQWVFKNGKQEICRYQMAFEKFPRQGIEPAYARGGYIAALYAPSGVLVTDDYAEGHIHHHGIWMAWTKTAFEGRTPDFWNMGMKKGRVDFISCTDPKPGDLGSTFEAKHRYIDMLAQPEKPALEESWSVSVFHLAEPVAAHGIEITVQQTCAGSAPLVLPQYHYGGLGFRGHAQWLGADKSQWLTSEGQTDRGKANESRGRWCWQGGSVDGKLVGVAILSHRQNLRHPEPMRVHPKEPFFCFAPQQLGEFSIQPGQTLTRRYRLLAMDGTPKAETLQAAWEQWHAAAER